MGRKTKKKIDLGPPPDPMPLETPRHGQETFWEDLLCRIQIRLVGSCNSCQTQQHTEEHFVNAGAGGYEAYFCDKCCLVCNEDQRVAIEPGDLIETLRNAWKIFPMLPVEYYPTPSEFALLRAVKRR